MPEKLFVIVSRRILKLAMISLLLEKKKSAKYTKEIG
jgi:hypothetical protein